MTPPGYREAQGVRSALTLTGLEDFPAARHDRPAFSLQSLCSRAIVFLPSSYNMYTKQAQEKPASLTYCYLYRRERESNKTHHEVYVSNLGHSSDCCAPFRDGARWL